MMTDAELKRCLKDYECESLPQMLRDVAALSKHCTSEAGGRIPTWPLHEAAERLEAMTKCVEALKEIAKQVPAKDMDEDYYDAADFEDGYDRCIFAARAALASLKEVS